MPFPPQLTDDQRKRLRHHGQRSLRRMEQAAWRNNLKPHRRSAWRKALYLCAPGRRWNHRLFRHGLTIYRCEFCDSGWYQQPVMLKEAR